MNHSLAIGNCTPEAIAYPVIFGAEFLAIEAQPVWNFTTANSASTTSKRDTDDKATVNFCNITLTHTHPGKNNTLHTQIWLPFNATWNKRWMMSGGGGWSAGLLQLPEALSAAVASGYATSAIDGGVANDTFFSASSWALTSPGNVDYDALQDFAVRGLIDGALGTKSVIESFYGTGPEYSYWSGCSQGGRQGYMFAERYPDVFDGISTSAPAINWNPFFFSSLYPQQVLYELDLEVYPRPCEYDSLTEAAIAACDGNDGLIDRMISDPDGCSFDPQPLIGAPAAQCDPSDGHVISEAAVLAMNALWQGPSISNGTRLWYGHGYEANATTMLGTLTSTCSNNGTCVPSRLSLFTDWIRYFIKKDPEYDFNNMTRQEWISAFNAGEREYASFLNTNYPDLSEFRASGGKLLTYHGLSDQLIPFGGSRDYYNRVSVLDPNLRDFYRYFEAPGAAHCVPGRGGLPDSFAALVDWVENGIVPETLVATDSEQKEHLLCLYPKKAVFTGNPANYTAKDFVCE